MVVNPIALSPLNYNLPRLALLHIGDGVTTRIDSAPVSPFWFQNPPVVIPQQRKRGMSDNSDDPHSVEMCRALKTLLENRNQDQIRLKIRLNDANWTSWTNIPRPFKALISEYDSISYTAHVFEHKYGIPHEFFPV